MANRVSSDYQSENLRAVRPYLIVGNANAAIDFYCRVFEAKVVERHATPSGAIAHVKLQIGESIIELGENPDARDRSNEALPRIGLRLYVDDVDATYGRATLAGAKGDAPSDRPGQGVRGATVYDPFGLTWWLAGELS